ncbi:CHAT domain-containing protein [Nonomuraea fuscirosea]|uniref:CHAT domain-containing protein n=1 Tax=Nonomuraea fuscirosea TaxID=1291556 RepID=UPI002DDC147B|nr:CHAT domain-containing protein [Nonomuraea fuscirosea]WSA57416.1 CHAT domain-containing protein [Nonomuraea fuscirosea]
MADTPAVPPDDRLASARAAVEAAGLDPAERIRALVRLYDLLQQGLDAGRDDLLDEAVDLGRALLAAAPDGDVLFEGHATTDPASDHDATASGDPPSNTDAHTTTSRETASRTGTASDTRSMSCADATSDARSVLDAAARRQVGVCLSVDLVRRYRLRGGPEEDLELAIRLGRARVRAGDLVTLVPDLVNLAGALLTSWTVRERADHLDEAVELLEPIVADADVLAPAMNSDVVEAGEVAMLHVNLAAAYSDRYNLARRPEDLVRAIGTLRVAVTGPDPSITADARMNLASVLLAAHDTGAGADDPLGEAARIVDDLIPDGDDSSHSWTWWYTAARVRLAQFDADGRAEHLDQAGTALTRARAGLAAGSAEWASQLAAEAALAFICYSHNGDRLHLEAAIATAQQAQALDHANPSDLAILANQVCLAVTERFELDGDRDDLDLAVSLAREALAQGQRLDIVRALRVNLAHALHQRYQLTGARRDLVEGIATIAPALRSMPPSPDRAIALGIAATLYGAKALTMRADGNTAMARADVDQAVRHAREALSLASGESRDRVIYGSGLASWLMGRGEMTGSQDDLDEAVACYESALAGASEDSTARARIAYTLAGHYAARAELTIGPEGIRVRDLAQAQRACDLWDEALAAEQPFISQFAGQRLGEIAFALGDWAKCEKALALSLDAARALTARRPRLADQERARFAVQGTAAVAALAATRAGDPERAVVHLEQASATLLAEAAGRPADRASFPEIAAATQRLGGPLVYWAVTETAGAALIVTPEGVVVPVPLEVTAAEVSRVLDELRAAFTDRAAGLPEWDQAVARVLRWTWDGLVAGVVAAMGPVRSVGLVPVGRLAALPLTTARAPGEAALFERTVPRVLPNARSAEQPAPWPATPRAAVVCDAGDGDDHLPAVGIEARRVAARYPQDETPEAGPPVWPTAVAEVGQGDVQAAVRPEAGVSTTAGMTDATVSVTAGTTAGVAVPARRILRHSGGPPSEQASEAGVVDDFLGRLRTADVAHIACHFQLDFADPFASTLRYMSGLRLADLFGRTLTRPAHVVLSACDSGLAGTRLPDETIGPAPLLLACGARSVLAALWPLDDATTPDFMDEYHRRLAAGVEPAAALAGTQRAVAGSVPLAVWPAFVHIGP